MVHDELCELKRMSGTSCHCAQRAYAKDPIEGVPNPYDYESKEIDAAMAYFNEWMQH